MRSTHLSLRLILAGSLLVAGSLVATCGIAVGADAQFVGVLSLLEDPKVAEQLELSEDVAAKLKTLISAREDAAEPLVLGTKELEPAERTARIAKFVEESEKLGLALLTQEQRTRLSQLRIAREGLVSLADSKVAEQVGLSAGQAKQVETLVAELRATLSKGNERERQVAKGEQERKLAAVLSKDQKARWDALAGKGPAPSAVVKTTEEKGLTTPTTEPGTTKPVAEKPSVASKPSSKPAAKPAAAEPKKDVKLTFSFVYAPYKDVLDWLATQADLSLNSDIIPPGTFNYSDSHEYTPAEAIDRINRILQFKGYLLIRDGRTLMVINIDDGIPRHIVDQIDEKQLASRGESEIVTVLFQLARMTPEEAAAELDKMKSPFGSIVTLPRARQLLLTDSVGTLRLMRKMIDAVEKPNQGGIGDSPQWVKYQLGGADPAVVQQVLETILTDLPEKKFVIDPKGVILVHTSPDGHKRVKAMLEDMETGGDIAVIKVIGDPQALMLSINKLFGAGELNAPKVEADPLSNQLMVKGNKSQVDQIQKFLKAKGEIPEPVVEGGPTVRSNRRTIPLAGTTAAQQRILDAAISTFNASRRNKVTTKNLTVDAAANENGGSGNQGFDPRGGGFEGRGFDGRGFEGRGFDRGFEGRGFPDQRGLIGPGGFGTPGNPQGPAEQPRPEQPRAAAPARPTTSGFAPAPRVAPKPPMTPAAPPAAEAPKAAPAEAPKTNDTTARRSGPRYQFVGFGQEEPAKEQPKKEPVKPESQAEAAAPAETAKEAVPSQEKAEPAKEPAIDEAATEKAASEKAALESAAGDILEKYNLSVVNYALDIIKEHDKNQDGTLDSEEWKAHKWSTPAEESDADKDGKLSLEELCARVAKRSDPQDAPEEKTVPGAPVTMVVTSSGITITSDDLDALDEMQSILEDLVRVETDPIKRRHRIHLKFIKAENAVVLITSILSGGASEQASSGGGGGGRGGMMGGMMSMMMGGGNPLDSLLGGGSDGAAGSSSTGVGIVADPQRNDIWVSATNRDLDQVQDILKVIDQPPGPDTQINPAPRYIQVKNQNAEDIATKIRALYASRLEGGGSQRQQQQPNPLEMMRALTGRGGNQNQNNKGEELKIALTVDERSNQIIVSAPDYLFQEIEQLVHDLDTATVQSDEVMAVVKLDGANADLIQRSLTKMIPSATTGRTSPANQTGLARNGTGQQGSGFQQGGFQGGGFQGQGGFNPAQLFQGGGGGIPGFGGGFGGQGGGGFGGQGGGGFNRGGGGQGGFGGGGFQGGGGRGGGGFGGGGFGGGGQGGGGRGGGGFGGGGQGGGGIPGGFRP